MDAFSKQVAAVSAGIVFSILVTNVVQRTSESSLPHEGVDAVGPVSAEVTHALNYKPVPDWLHLPSGRPETSGLYRRIGNMHGDIAISSNGDVFVSVQALDKNNLPLPAQYADPMAGLQVYDDDGSYIRNVPNAPPNLHGFVIRKESEGEFIYGVRLATTSSPEDQARAGVEKQSIVKMSLAGKTVLAIPASAIPDQFKNKDNKTGKPYLRLTGLAVAPNGDIYAADGYSSDYIHRFDRHGNYIASFGGKGEPYSFKTLHKLAIDTRFAPARILACDRANNRMVHLSLEGKFLGEYATDLKLPAAVAIHGDYAAIGELQGRVTILDREGNVISGFGTNTAADEIGSKLVEPARWRLGIVIAPHGIAFNKHGDLFVSEINIFGRVDRFNRQ